MNQKGMVGIQTCQPELLFHEIFHLRESLVGSLVLFHYDIEERPVKKHTLYNISFISCIIYRSGLGISTGGEGEKPLVRLLEYI